jgi:2-keto-4-pentenoate hydratase
MEEALTNSWDDPRVKRGTNAQLADWRKRIAAGDGRLGWKVAFGTPAIMETLKISAPLTGFLLRRNLLPSGGSVSLKGWSKPIAEPEIAVHMGKDLAAGADHAAVADAIGALGSAIELVDPSMTPQPDNLETVLAADIFQRHVVLGEPSKARAGGSVAGLVATIFRNGVESGSTKDPEANTGKLIERVWNVANTLAAFGEKLSAGDVIITGSVLPPVPLSASDQRFSFTLAPLGEVSINFAH